MINARSPATMFEEPSSSCAQTFYDYLFIFKPPLLHYTVVYTCIYLCTACIFHGNNIFCKYNTV